MTPAGKVQSVYGKLLIISLKQSVTRKALPLKQSVVDSRGKVIGRIIDIFGPVKTPYAVVKPVKKPTAPLSHLVKADIYLKR